MPHTITVPLVGMHFNPPAKQVLAVLPQGQALRLMAEPDNAYDAEAILVFVDWSTRYEEICEPAGEPPVIGESYYSQEYEALAQALDGTGFDIDELREDCTQFKLGHVGATGRGPCKKLGLPGTQEVHEFALHLADADLEALRATLGFTPDGAPVVLVSAPEAQA